MTKMTKKLIKEKVETASAETEPPSNFDRLRTHLKADSLALKLVDSWTSAEPQAAKARLLKAVEDHFREKKQGDGAAGPED